VYYHQEEDLPAASSSVFSIKRWWHYFNAALSTNVRQAALSRLNIT